MVGVHHDSGHFRAGGLQGVRHRPVVLADAISRAQHQNGKAAEPACGDGQVPLRPVRNRVVSNAFPSRAVQRIPEIIEALDQLIALLAPLLFPPAIFQGSIRMSPSRPVAVDAVISAVAPPIE